jgi:hypothetical protein
MAAFTGLEAREQMAVLKIFADDTSGSMANVFLGMDLEERGAYYIGSIVYNI